MRTWKPGHVVLIWGASAFLCWFVYVLGGTERISVDTAFALWFALVAVPFILTWMWLSRR